MAAEGGKAARVSAGSLLREFFISYRRDDAPGYAGRLADALTHRLGDRVEIFIDVDSITPGIDFADRIHDAVGQCDVLVELIGLDGRRSRRRTERSDWQILTTSSASNSRRRSAAAYRSSRRGRPRRGLPSVDEIPESLTPIVRREAIACCATRASTLTFRGWLTPSGFYPTSKRARTIPLAVAGVIAVVALVGIAYLVLKPSGGGYPNAAEKSLLSPCARSSPS